MEVKDRFIKRYAVGSMPWVHQKPDFNLTTKVQDWPVEPCKTLEIGCGTGTDAIWLASKGFNVTAIDVSDIAINIARNDANQVKSNCCFEVKDFMQDKISGGPFQFVFDRGFFHSFDKTSARKSFASRVSMNLTQDGLWLSLLGSADDLPRKRGDGPPQRSAATIVKAVEPYFEILSMTTSFFGSDSPVPAKIWVCLMKKRQIK